MSETRPVRTRRSSEDVRALILESARSLFLDQGFEATTTKQICDRAGVAEPLLFSNFGNKAELFELSVLTPVAEFVAEYADVWSGRAQDQPRERVDSFVSGLYEVARRNRAVLLEALSRRRQRRSGGGDVIDHLAGTLRGLVGVSDLDRYHDVDAPAAMSAAVGMVLGVALLDDLLFPTGTRRPSRERLVAEVEKLLFYGITRRD